MTSVVACVPDRLASDDVATESEEPESRVRNLRVDNQRWKDFARAVGLRRRSAWLNVIIDAVLADPELWREVEALAKLRGETVAGAINRQMRKYRAGE